MKNIISVMEWRMLFAKVRKESTAACQLPNEELKEMIESVFNRLFYYYT